MTKQQKLIKVATGRVKAELVLKNANVINVFTKEILQRQDVAIQDGIIAGVGNYEGVREVDCADKTICPGFVDAHLHIESSMAQPSELVKKVLPWGTTTLVADPHEIVNVAGAEGMQFMLDASEGLPCNVYMMLPSSVPTTMFETAGADFTVEDMRAFLQHPRVLGLGEVMCYPDVLAGRDVILDKIAALQGRVIDGHAPDLLGKELQAYVAAGVMTEHECTSFEEALEKVRAGLAILVREGSAAHNLQIIVQGLVESGTPTERFMFCTDDKHLDDIGRDGHIRWNVKMAIDLGMNPVDAICMGSWNAAQVYHLQGVGAVAAGYKADLIVLNNLRQMEIGRVYKDGVPAEEQIQNITGGKVRESLLHSVKVKEVSVEDFALPVKEETSVIEMVPYQLITRHLREQVPAKAGKFVPDDIYTKLCVVERHGKNGNIAVAPLKGYGIQNGAIATTVAHDSHNIIVAGDNDTDIAMAVNTLRQTGGGYVLVQKGKVAGTVPLSIGGLMSEEPAEEVERKTRELIEKAREMGIPYYVDPFISLSFLALAVIPSLRLTDKGLFDVETFTLM